MNARPTRLRVAPASEMGNCTGELLIHRDAKPLGNFRKAWAAACRAAGVSGRLFHDLRRSAVRNLVRAGTPERVAMAISGHKTRSIFDRYSIVSEDNLAAAMERTHAYVEQARQDTPRVRPLEARAVCSVVMTRQSV